ncbi:hypothetical protein VEx25_B0122 [Vibrio antiquarius]|uniref:Uncharacterized protein n=1 Tax=Vibrio antiquarius (strain Ex25) TaxID=150340 RepID=A0ABM9WXG1_VIBAE|nr:hypothetical protein VEx25_B0122 [Vibrio antiquarius]
MKPHGTANAAENGLTTPKKRFWKTHFTVRTFNKVTETKWNLQHQRKRHFSE